MKMKKVAALALTLTLLGGVLGGCGSADGAQAGAESVPAEESESAAEGNATAEGGAAEGNVSAEKDAAGGNALAEENTPVAGSDGETQVVSTDGSTSMEKVIGFLSEAYMEENGNIKVTYNPTGSGSGIQAVSEGRCDIGLSSRDLKEEEQADLVGTVVALDGIAVIVNPENTVEDLSIEQIAKIYTGEITNWEEVGGEDASVVCIGREAASGTRDGFEEVTGTKDNCVYSQELTSTGDVVQTVSGNPGAIGYASVASLNESVKAVSVEGVAPSVETIQSGVYKIQRNFVLVTKKDAPLSEAAQNFFDFATGEAADGLITEAGAVPVRRG